MNKQCGKVKHFCAYCQKYFERILFPCTQKEGFVRRPNGGKDIASPHFACRRTVPFVYNKYCKLLVISEFMLIFAEKIITINAYEHKWFKCQIAC